MFKEYAHIGIPHQDPMEGEVWDEGMKVWKISARTNEFHFEFLRYREDTWMAKEVQTQMHVACEVDNIEEVLPLCDKILHARIVVRDDLTIALVIMHGVLLELMERK